MNIYLIIILFLYIFFLSLFPVLNKINHWLDVSMSTFYLGAILSSVNIIIVIRIAKIIKLNLKGRLGKGMIKGILYTTKPFSFAEQNNLLHVQSTIKYYNNASETMISAFLEKSNKHPYAHFKLLQTINLFADEIFLKYNHEEIPFTQKLKNMINPYIDSDNTINKAVKEISYQGMINLIKKGEIPGLTEERINAVASYQQDGQKRINRDTKFVLFTRAISSDNREDLLIGLDEDFNPDIDAYTHKVEDNIGNIYLRTFFMLLLLPPFWIAAVSFFILNGGGGFNFENSVKLYLYGSFFQIPFYYFLAWKYITQYNKTNLFK